LEEIVRSKPAPALFRKHTKSANSITRFALIGLSSQPKHMASRIR
jgi:hypothetical protein